MSSSATFLGAVGIMVFVCLCSSSRAAALSPLPLKDVKITGGFWGPKLQTNRSVTVWHNFKQCESTGRIANFKRAAGIEQGPHQGAFFNDSDVYKVIEGASYILAQHPDDAKLDKYLDELIAIMVKAQRPDGYLYTYYQLRGEDPAKRFSDLKDMHELYCAGHLIEAGVAHYQATGKRSLLDVAIRYADLIDATFGPDERHDVCGHEEIELALFKLSAVTNEPKYAKLAEYFVRQRGRDDGRKLFGLYHQDHEPLEKSGEVVGHAVRQMYFLCAAADATRLGEQTYAPAMDRMWRDLVERKMYVTGGVGAKHEGEAFGAPYELPNESAYAETCAGIGNMLWQERMGLNNADAKYYDALETALYNGFLSGVSLSGDLYFYVNPLASRGLHHRVPWFGCACCPPNVVRFMASLPARVYATRGDELFVNLYVASEAKAKLAGCEVSIRQRTDYPWDGKVRIEIDPQLPAKFAVKLRIPKWCAEARVVVNGRAEPSAIEKGYASLHRDWKPGDTIELALPMPVRRVYADARVKDDVGRVALARGPIVYCAEAVDNGGRVSNLVLARDAKIEANHRDDLLGGVTVLSADAEAKMKADEPPRPARLIAVPYFAWDNRKAEEMAVWLAEDAAVAVPPPAPTIANQSTPSASYFNPPDSLLALNDDLEPKGSNDHSMPRFTWWSHKGSTEWVQYDFGAEKEVSAAEVYFFDDEPGGGCRVPASWQLFYRAGEEWKPVEASGDYATKKDTFNRVSFKAVKTSAMRLEVKLKDGFSGGILEWRVQ